MRNIIKIATWGVLGFVLGHLCDAAGYPLTSWEYWAFLGGVFTLVSVIGIL